MDAAALSIIASVVGTGVAIAVFGWRVVVRLEPRLDRQIERLEDRLGGRMDRAEEARQSDVREISGQVGELRERMARIEGLRKAVTGRRAA